MAYIKCQNLSVGYAGETLIENINFEVHEHDYLCIVGKNGVGKSTLMKTLLGLVDKKEGNVEFGKNINRKEVGYLPQQTALQKDFPATVMEVVLSGNLSKIALRPFYRKKEKERALLEMKKLKIDSLASRSYRELSGGQQQRVLLARALCATEKILFLDEPTTGLDPQVTKEFYDMLKELNKKGMAIIMVSHDLSVLEEATHVLYLRKNDYVYARKEEFMNTYGKEMKADVNYRNI